MCEIQLGSISRLVAEGAAPHQQRALAPGAPGDAGAGSDAWPNPSAVSLPSFSLWRSKRMGDRPNECFAVV